jgi:hypothetical protein
VVHWVVEARNFSDGEFTISVVAVDEPAEGDDGPDDDGPDDDGPDEGGDCPYTEDNECDEPEGTGWCPEGSDTVDCTCPYTQDGDCDEPEGTGLCPEGSDPYDC